MRPYYLDGDLAQHDPKVLQGPVIPVISRRLSMAAELWLLCSFQGPWRGDNAGLRSACAGAISNRVCAGRKRAPVSQNSTACWGRLRAMAYSCPQVVRDICDGRPSSQVRSTC